MEHHRKIHLADNARSGHSDVSTSTTQAISSLFVPLYAQNESALAAGITNDTPPGETQLRTESNLTQPIGARPHGLQDGTDEL